MIMLSSCYSDSASILFWITLPGPTHADPFQRMFDVRNDSMVWFGMVRDNNSDVEYMTRMIK